jgi:hypothetical protein
LKIKKENSSIITPSGAEARKKSNVSSNDLISIKRIRKDKNNLRNEMEKSSNYQPKYKNISNIKNLNVKLNKVDLSAENRIRSYLDFEQEKDLDKK